MHLADAAALVGGRLENAGSDPEINGVQTLTEAGEAEASFLHNMRYKDDFEASKASVILIAEDVLPDTRRTVIRVKDPYLAFAQLQNHFYPQPTGRGVRAESAVIDASAEVADDVDIGANAVIGANTVIGAATIIAPGCVIGDNVRIGEGCLLHAGAVVEAGCILHDRVILQAGAVIGSDGFGYAWSGSGHLKIPQVGRVVLEDDVEIGANTTIDRGAIGDTIIRRGVKLDNQIQIAHNVEVGAFTVMASQVGISGSTSIGAGCQFGGQSGVAGHLKIGDGCKLGAKSGVAGDLEAGGTYSGYPAIPHRIWLRSSALVTRLPEIWKLLKKKDD